MPKDGRKWLGIRLADAIHSALIKHASIIGKHPTDIAADFVERQLIEAVSESPSVEIRVWLASQDAKRRDAMRAQLEHVAFVAIRESDDDAMAALENLCDEAGISIEEIMDSASRLGGKLVEASSEGAKSAGVKAAIFSILRNGAVPAREAARAVREQTGASRPTVDIAKRDLGVESYKDGKHWMWRLSEEEAVEARKH